MERIEELAKEGLFKLSLSGNKSYEITASGLAVLRHMAWRKSKDEPLDPRCKVCTAGEQLLAGLHQRDRVALVAAIEAMA